LMGGPFNKNSQWLGIAGIGLGLDLTRREVQAELKKQGLPWTKAKSYAGSAILSPFLAPEKFSSVDDISFVLEINGDKKQTGNSREMIFSVQRFLEELTSFHPLEAGDVIFTGTPSGVGPLRVGDKVKLSFPVLGVSFDGTI
jgi:acylpyruvate hydrolase